MDEKTLARIGAFVVRLGLSVPSLGLLLMGVCLSAVVFTSPHSGGFANWVIVLFFGCIGLLLAWSGLYGLVKAWRVDLLDQWLPAVET